MTEGPLLIVDNSEGGRNGLDYLREWSELASSIDIATGYFEIGSLLDLDGHWQKFDKIRIALGARPSWAGCGVRCRRWRGPWSRLRTATAPAGGEGPTGTTSARGLRWCGAGCR